MNEMDVFLKDTPYMLIQKGPINQVPWIVGVTDQVCLLDAASEFLISKTEQIFLIYYSNYPNFYFPLRYSPKPKVTS